MALSCSGLALGQVWAEVGDAGELPGTAQTPIGSGVLTTITGNRAPDADMFLIHIPDPAAGFVAKTWDSSVGDTQLFLFNLDGTGVTFNDDAAGHGLFSEITNQFVGAPGNYYLAISSFDTDPRTADDDEIWLDQPFGVERQPDGPGAGGTVANWFDATPPAANDYQIDLRGVEYVPEPATLALLGLGGLALIRRR